MPCCRACWRRTHCRRACRRARARRACEATTRRPIANRTRSLARAQCQATMVEARYARGRGTWRVRHVDQHARLLAHRHAQARQTRFRDAQAGRAMPPHCLPESGRQAHLRQTFPRSICRTPITRKTSPRTSSCATPPCRNHPSTTSMPVRRRGIAQPPSMNGWMRAASPATSSTRRTACTARPATSKTRTATSPGCRRRAAVGRTLQYVS